MPSWKPSASVEMLKQRAQMLFELRAFFLRHDVLEVETPALSQAANSDPYIESFSLDKGQRFLHTSPEYPMKRLLAAGCGDIYQICKVWRSEEAGKHHNPEFTLLEWYRVGFSYQQLMSEVELLLTSLLSLKKPSKFYSYQQLFIEFLQLNPHKANHSTLISCVRKNAPEVEMGNGVDWSRQDLLDLLLTHCLEPVFNKEQLTFVYDYPITQSALANVRSATQTEAAVAERFEVYLGSCELGNGYQELTDAAGNKEVIASELNQRKQRMQTTQPKDKYFLQAMEHGIPFTSGVAIGIDRLLMCKFNKKHIQQVISFPWDTA